MGCIGVLIVCSAAFGVVHAQLEAFETVVYD